MLCNAPVRFSHKLCISSRLAAPNVCSFEAHNWGLEQQKPLYWDVLRLFWMLVAAPRHMTFDHKQGPFFFLSWPMGPLCRPGGEGTRRRGFSFRWKIHGTCWLFGCPACNGLPPKPAGPLLCCTLQLGLEGSGSYAAWPPMAHFLKPTWSNWSFRPPCDATFQDNLTWRCTYISTTWVSWNINHEDHEQDTDRDPVFFKYFGGLNKYGFMPTWCQQSCAKRTTAPG